MTRTISFVLAAWLAACQVSLGIPDQAEVRCTADSDCPPGWICDPVEDLCSRPGVVRVAPPAAPTVVVQSVTGEAAPRPLAQVRLAVVVADANAAPAGDETVSVRVEYSIDGSAWSDATLSTGEVGTVAVDASPEGEPVTLTWDALATARAGPPLVEEPRDRDGDEAADDTVVGYEPEVWLRVTPTDSSGAAGDTATSNPFALGNHAPTTTLDPIPAVGGGMVPIGFKLTDSAADVARVELVFRRDATDAWRNLALLAGNLDAAFTAEQSPGFAHLVLWDSTVPISIAAEDDQGVGSVALDSVELRARAVDAIQGVESHGPWTAALLVPPIVNQHAPTVEGVVVRETELHRGTGPVAITYRAVDEESDPVDVFFEYSLDIGETWSPCREFAAPASEGRRDLATGPARESEANGTLHTYVWDTTGLALASFSSTRLRLTVTDGNNLGAPFHAEEQLVSPAGPPAGATPFASDTYGVGAGPGHIATGDLNDDQIVDAVVSNEGSGSISVLLGNGSGGVGDGTFTPLAPMATNGSPVGIAIADFDEDDIPDLAVCHTFCAIVPPATEEAPCMQILSGDGTGGFTLLDEIAIDCGYPPTAADFDDDGLADLAVGLFGRVVTGNMCSNPRSEKLAVLAGHGDGTFESPVEYTSGPCPSSTVAADLNGDNNVDLAVANEGVYNVSSVRLFVGDGSGAFTAETLTTGPSFRSIVRGDFNMDGIDDLAVGTSHEQTIEVLLGERLAAGGETDGLRGPVSYSVGAQTTAIAQGDINDDGIADLLVPIGVGMTVLLGDGAAGHGDGTFGVPMAVVTNEVASAAAVLQGHGTARVLLSERDSDQVRLLRRQPATALAQFAQYETVATAVTDDAVAAADLNGDESLDLLVGDNSTVGATVLTGSLSAGLPDGTFETTGDYYAAGEYPRRVLLHDVNADGQPDAVLAWSNIGRVSVHLGQVDADGVGLGTFDGGTEYTTTSTLFCLDTGDFDGDGITDIVGGSLYGGSVRVLLGNDVGGVPDGTFAVSPSHPAGDSPQIAVGDLDNDGCDDLVVSSRSGDGISILLGGTTNSSGDAPFADQVPYSTGAGTSPRGVDVGDLDDDGILDVIAPNTGASTVNVAFGIGDGTVGAFTPVDVGCDNQQVRVADVTADGIDDLVVYCWSAEISVLAGESSGGLGTGAFQAPTLIPLSAGTQANSAMADINGDGLLDIVMQHGNYIPALTVLAGQSATLGIGTEVRLDRVQTDVLGSGMGVVGSGAVPTGIDRFGATIRSTINLRVAEVAPSSTVTDFERELRTQPAGADLADDAVWITAPHEAVGDRTLARGPDPSLAPGDTSDQTRLRMENRLDLDLAAADFADRRGVMLELPIPGARDLSSGTVRLFRRTVDWRRADTVTADPINLHADAADYMAMSGGRELRIRTVTWTEIQAAPGGDWTAATGSRFAVDASNPNQRFVRVLTDRLGIFQAFLEP